jgi:hypothetical protein
MKKLLAVLLVCVLVAFFAFGAIFSTAEARPPCIATCINGTYWVCCPGGNGAWFCGWDGPCNW